MSGKYNVYVIPAECNYSGVALVAAENAEKANQYIDAFITEDSHNECNSYGYCHTSEYELIDEIYAERPGIIYRGIYYTG